MRRVLSTDRGSELYGKRQPMIEPVFANTKFNRKITRFHRRGRAAVRTEWRLITADPQPPQAPQPPDRRRERLIATAGETRTAAPPAIGDARYAAPAGVTRQPRLQGAARAIRQVKRLAAPSDDDQQPCRGARCHRDAR